MRATAASCRRYRQAVAEYHVWQKRFDRSFLAGGGVLPIQQSAPAETWVCDTCSRAFASRKALATHAGRVHGYRRVEKFYAIGNTCHACCKCYHSRQRYIEHLKFVPGCLETMKACFPPLDDDVVQALDREDQAHTHTMRQQGWGATKALVPVRKVAGPSLPPADSEDARTMHAKWQQRMQQGGSAFQNLSGRRAAEGTDEPKVHLFEDDLPAFLFESVAGPNAGDGRFARTNLAREHARLHITSLVFVHVFSGYRRCQDLHQLLEHKIWGSLHFFVLSIDMCIQKLEGNLATSDAFSFWTRQIQSGQICGLGGGPPCETFSAARLMADGPPPLRSGHWHLGFPNLAARPWHQCMVGSRLIRFIIEALLNLAMVGGCGFLEHPQFPLWAARRDPASIWRLREMKLLRTLECVAITSFDQCTVGADAKKPTTVLHVRLPSLREALQASGHRGRCNHGPNAHVPMAGRDGTGQFHTARAKIYPPGLNAAIAKAIFDYAQATFGSCDTSPNLPTVFGQYVTDNFVPMEFVQPDFHG